MKLLLPFVLAASMTTCGALALDTTPKPQHHSTNGWQSGGQLRSLYQAAVKSIHDRDFDRAESLCAKGLRIAPGDKAFTDLQGQIPRWRRDTLQAQVAAQYQKAVELVHEGKLNAGEQACREGLRLEPGNNSFAELLRDIDSRRHVSIQNYLVEVYQEAATLMNEGKYRAATAKCDEGLRRAPDDPQLRSLLRMIRHRQNGDESR